MSGTYITPFLFVIDTTDYAGNFERELCGYITGHVGDCEVGADEAEIFYKEVPTVDDELFENVISQPTGDNPCNRPCEICPTPGWYNDGAGNHFKDGEETSPELVKNFIDCIVKRENKQMDFPLKFIKTLEGSDEVEKALLLKRGWTREVCEKTIERHKTAIADVEKATILTKYPCYLSVAIFFESRPTDVQIALMKERAYKFAKLPHKWNDNAPSIREITGFRLIEQIISSSTTNI